jgi:kynureninase
VLASSVLFANARRVPGLDRVLAACRARGAELLVDAYHQLNVVPMALASEGLGEAFVTGGGYKYCQLGEGNAFLRVPPGRDAMFPIVTGWYSEFARLAERSAGAVPYGEGPARWAGSTYDPTSHYRAARVFEFFREHALDPEFLREVSQHQVGRLAQRFDALDLDPAVLARDRAVPLERVGGFLALSGRGAGAICAELEARGVASDFRGEVLRLGPAPYLSDRQLDDAITALGEAARTVPATGRS